MNKSKEAFKLIGKIIVVVFALIGVTATILGASLFKQPKELLTAISAFQLLKGHYYTQVNEGELVEGLTKGMAASLKDPYTVYYTKKEYDEFNSHLTGVYAGIGVLMGLDKETQVVKAVKVFAGSPAANSGLQPGDLILEVDGVSTENKNVEEVANKARGEAGTTVKIVIMRRGEILTFPLVRGIIKAPSVSGAFLKSDKDTYYLEISTFGNTTASEMNALLKSLDHKPKRLVLDLRNNGGGIVDQAVEIAGYFINGGVVLYETARDSKKVQTFEVGNEAFLDIPLVVLVNEDTASSAEILSGAIQDHKTGVLVGTKTFGKAVVQTIIPMPTGGALKFTTQRYLTPLKRDISKEGLTPDYVVVESEEEKGRRDYSIPIDEMNDIQLRKALEILGQLN